MLKKVGFVVLSLIVPSFLGLPVAAAEKASAPKTASEFFLKYHAAMSKAKTIEDLRPFMDAESQKQMDAAPKDQQEMGVQMISAMYAGLVDVKVVKETAKGNVYTLELTATQAADKQAGTGTAEVVKDGTTWRVESEEWKFGSSTMTLKRKN